MGLIQAGLGALGGVLADQWKEFFYCDALPKDVLAVKGQKKISGRSSNTKGNDNVISDGSVIAVADGQCMMIVEQGKIVEFCAEPGEFTYKTDLEPSIFTGKLGDSLKETFKELGKRFTFGGDPGKDQRVYYFNTKEILDNKFGTPNPVPFRVVDSKIGLDIDVSLRCAGIYSYKITNPMLFYANVCGNVEHDYTREEIDGQLKTEFVSALQPAFGDLSNLEIRPNQLMTRTTEMEAALNKALSEKWAELRGIEVVNVAFATLTLPEEDQKIIKKAQQSAMYSNAGMAAGAFTTSQTEAMVDAANNTNGAVGGFMGMGMAVNAGGSTVQGLFNAAAEQKAAAAPADTWKCPACGADNSGKFCTECGAKKPESWKCSCGAENSGNFCTNCGAKKPETWKCSCGTENSGNFCTNCGEKKPE